MKGCICVHTYPSSRSVIKLIAALDGAVAVGGTEGAVLGGRAALVATAGAADALQVVLGAHREVVVDDERTRCSCCTVTRSRVTNKSVVIRKEHGDGGRRSAETGLGEEPA